MKLTCIFLIGLIIPTVLCKNTKVKDKKGQLVEAPAPAPGSGPAPAPGPGPAPAIAPAGTSDKDAYYPIYPNYWYYQVGFCPGEKPRFYGDACDDDHPCYDYSLQCNNNQCVCIDNYLQSTNPTNGMCEPAPYLNQPCTTQCQRPYQCVAAKNADGTDSTQKTCQCVSPYTLENGWNCYMACKADQKYDKQLAKCIPGCTADQVRLEDGSCATTATLNGKCTDDAQCIWAFTKCVNGYCVCPVDFDSGSTGCIPKKYNCPCGDALYSNSHVVTCTKTNPYYYYYYSYPPKDSCPAGYFCNVYPPINYSPGAVNYGHCCPKLNLKCPVGQALTGYTCDYYSQPYWIKPYQKFCPWQTHYCYSVSDSNGHTESLCCPKTCRDDQILIDGSCWSHLDYGDYCKYDQQCEYHNGVCVDGKCQCPPNAMVSGGAPYQYCYVSCGSNEVQYMNKCYARLKLGAKCSHDPPELCPYNAGCDENNTCSCFCNYIPIGSDRCEPYPVCRRQYYYYYYAPAPAPGSAAAWDNTSDAQAKPAPEDPPCTDVAVAKSASDYTFCVVPGQVPPTTAVAHCPCGQYCSYYTYDLGLCCQTPKPVCSDGSAGNGTCSPYVADQCGPNGYCYQYYYPVDGNGGYTCCQYQQYYPVDPPQPMPVDPVPMDSKVVAA